MKLVYKIGGGYLLIGLFLILAGMAGLYGISQLNQSLDYLSGPAWDTADGAMESAIEIERQMVAAREATLGINVEANRQIIADAQENADEAMGRILSAGLMDDEQVQEAEQSQIAYRDKLDTLLTSHEDFQQAHDAFMLNADQLVHLGERMEELADSAMEQLESAPNSSISWNSGLEENWDAADGGMESYIGLLRQIHLLEQLTDGMDPEQVRTEIQILLAFQEAATARMVTTPVFDVPAGSAYPGLTMAQAYADLLETHKALIQDYIETYEAFDAANTAYQETADRYLQFIDQMEERGDQTVEGEAENIAATQRTARTVVLGSLVVGGLVALVVGVVLTRSITQPVEIVTQAAHRIASGDVNQTIEHHSGDEIGMLADGFRRMIAYIQEMAGAASRLALGDVSVEVTPQSEQDVLGSAFTQMIAYQQEMARAANRLAQGDVTVQVTPQSEQDVLGNAFVQMVTYQQEMADVADRLAQGDLTATVVPQSKQDRLGSAFAQMIANLRSLIRQVAESADNVGIASRQLSAAADQAAHATNQVATTIQQVAGSTAQQTESVTNTTVTVDQMTRAIDGVAAGAQEQAVAVGRSAEITSQISAAIQQITTSVQSSADSAGQAAEAARAGADTVELTITGMDSIKQKVGLSSVKMREMGQRSEEIGAIVETIDDIASQTNLLALNAAIEAARAGEHGKGFAVVADEVRKLAENATDATQEIAALIRSIQQTVAEAIRAMDEGTAEIEAGAVHTDQAGQALDRILVAADAVQRQIEEIAVAANQMDDSAVEMVNAMNTVSAVVEENTASTEEMAAGASEVSLAIENIAAIAEENSAASEEVSATIEEVSAQAEEVTASADSLSQMAADLQAMVNNFRLSEQEDLTAKIELFKQAHLRWVTRLQDLMQGRTALKVDQVDSHMDCVLGRWYYGRGSIDVGDLPEYAALEEPHIMMHQKVRGVVAAHHRGDQVAAKAGLREVEMLSQEIVDLLDRLERRAFDTRYQMYQQTAQSGNGQRRGERALVLK